MDKYEATIEPWTKARGIDWEIQAEDADVGPFFSLIADD